MQSAHVVVESTTPITTRGLQVCGMFDAPPEKKQRLEWRVALPIDERPWQIGLIHGPSGSGKSTVSSRLFGAETAVVWRPGVALVDNFPTTMPVKEIAELCSAVGLNTIPAWLRPHEVLSNGEKFRANMARILAEAKDGDVVVVDEFTSVVDRQVARVASHALQKAIRKRPALRFVAVSCHSDIIDWLQPDWTLDMGSGGTFDWRLVQPRPKLRCTIARVDRSEWARFARYHYLTAELHSAAQCFGLWVDDTLVTFAGCLFRPHPKADNIIGVSRLVTLPDYQGLGLAFILTNAMGAMLLTLGWRLRTYPAHPSLIRSRDRSPVWACKKRPGTIQPNGRVSRMLKGDSSNDNAAGGLGGRPGAVFEYVGPAWTDRAEAMRVTRYLDRRQRGAKPWTGTQAT